MRQPKCERSSVLIAIAKARVWASEGWQVVVTDSEGKTLSWPNSISCWRLSSLRSHVVVMAGPKARRASSRARPRHARLCLGKRQPDSRALTGRRNHRTMGTTLPEVPP